jgi:CRISPR/Cas system CMR-associated protein Cmr1 (group 7 of RAMP superfamily)
MAQKVAIDITEKEQRAYKVVFSMIQPQRIWETSQVKKNKTGDGKPCIEQMAHSESKAAAG